MNIPTIEEISNKLYSLIDDKLFREEVADWASTFILNDDLEIDINVWDYLGLVAGVDLKITPTEYLHPKSDIQEWISRYSK